MKVVCSLVVLACAIFEAKAYPGYYPYYGNSYDSLSYGSSDNNRGGMVMSRYFNPYYDPRSAGGGLAAFMVKQPQTHHAVQQPSGQYYLHDRRRQTPQEETFYPQQNEVFFPQTPEKPVVTEATELAAPTEKVELIPTTIRTTGLPELSEPDVEEVEEPVKPKKRVAKKKQVKKPVEEDDEEIDENPPKMPMGAFFPMFFGYGSNGRSSGGMPGGVTAIANAYSTGRGGVATSHATAYGPPRPEYKLQP